MSLNLEQKKAVVADLAAVAGAAQSAIAADYRGLSVGDMTELRRTARGNGVYLRVVRNTLARRALEQTDFACMCDALSGPLLFAFSDEDPAAPARILTEFRKSHNKLEVKLVALNGKLLAPEAVESLAKLPTPRRGNQHTDGFDESAHWPACTYACRTACKARSNDCSSTRSKTICLILTIFIRS